VKPIPLFLTTLLHTLMLCLALSTCSELKQQEEIKPSPQQPEDGTDVQIKLLPSEKGLGTNCPDTYTGIGTITGFDGTVFEVAPGSPADKAGLRVGDELLNNEDFGINKWKEGTQKTMKIKRNGKVVTKTITIGTICYEDVQ
jgi:predicted metalloprotease with PDZ domain